MSSWVSLWLVCAGKYNYSNNSIFDLSLMETPQPPETAIKKERRDTAKTVASVFSTIFSPLLVPTYGVMLAMWLSVLSFLPTGIRWTVVGITFATTCLLPMLAIITMWRLGVVKDPQLNNRTERTTPYVVTGLCYLGCGFFLTAHHAPSWLCALMTGGALATMVCIIVNTRWKISAHMAAMGGLVALMFRIVSSNLGTTQLEWWLTATVVAAGCVGSSRVLLERHTLWQVIAGTATGFVCVFFLSMI